MDLYLINYLTVGTGFMASGRRQRVEDDKDDVYDDGRHYDYKPRKISLDEILSGSENPVSPIRALNSEVSVYLDQKFEYKVNAENYFIVRYILLNVKRRTKQGNTQNRKQ